MPVHPLVQYPNPVLRQVSAPIASVDDAVRGLATDLLDTMYAAPGRGLAAPQIGVSRRMLVIDCDWMTRARDPRICLNPVIIERSESLVVNRELCLSVPGLPAWIARPDWIVMRWLDLDDLEHTELLSDFDAVAAQHGLDLLNGSLFIDQMDDTSRAAAEAQLSKLRTP